MQLGGNCAGFLFGTAANTFINPPALTTNTNNWTPPAGSFFRVTATQAVNLTGVNAGTDGQGMLLWNVGSFAITVTNLDSNSTAANQWIMGTGSARVWAPNQLLLAQYSVTDNGWRVVLMT